MRRAPALSVLTIALVAAGLRPAPIGRRVAPDRRSFVFVSGNDTLGRESFTRTADSLTGDLLLGRKRFHYEARLLPNGTVPRIDVRTSGPGVGVTGTRLTAATFGRGSVRLVDHLDDGVDTMHVAVQAGAMPLINPSVALLELIIDNARAQKARTLTIPVLSVDVLLPAAVVVTLVSPDSAWIGTPNGPKDALRATLDAQGRITGGSLGGRRIVMLPTFTPLPPDISAQQSGRATSRWPAAAPNDVSSVDAIIKATYEANSVMVDQKRDADRFRSLYAPNAQMMNGVHDMARVGLNARSVDDYIAAAMSGPPRHGFSEREVARTSEAYGSIMQVFSTYESRRDSSDTHPTRGINSIQLFNDGKRWWVVSVLWDAESGSSPIPAKYLKPSSPR